jgi:hypothetical protein
MVAQAQNFDAFCALECLGDWGNGDVYMGNFHAQCTGVDFDCCEGGEFGFTVPSVTPLNLPNYCEDGVSGCELCNHLPPPEYKEVKIAVNKDPNDGPYQPSSGITPPQMSVTKTLFVKILLPSGQARFYKLFEMVLTRTTGSVTTSHIVRYGFPITGVNTGTTTIDIPLSEIRKSMRRVNTMFTYTKPNTTEKRNLKVDAEFMVSVQIRGHGGRYIIHRGPGI